MRIWYDVISNPLKLGGDHVITMKPFRLITVGGCGCDGTDAQRTAISELKALKPKAFRALTLNLYVTPLTKPYCVKVS